MFWNKKNNNTEYVTERSADTYPSDLSRRLSPIAESSKYLLSEKDRLQQEGDDFRSISDSFGILSEQEQDVKSSVDNFREKFDEVSAVTDEFDTIVKDIHKTVSSTNENIDNVRNSSNSVNEMIASVRRSTR